MTGVYETYPQYNYERKKGGVVMSGMSMLRYFFTRDWILKNIGNELYQSGSMNIISPKHQRCLISIAPQEY